MNKTKDNKNISKYIVEISEILVIAIGFLTVAATSLMVFGYKFNSYDNEAISTNIIIQIALSVLTVGVAVLLEYLLDKLKGRTAFIIRLVAVILGAAWIIFVGISFVCQTKIYQTADASACLELARLFSVGDLSAVTSKGSYLSLWPFQTGFIFLLEKQIRFLHMTDLGFQIENVIFVVLIYLSGIGVIRLYSKKARGWVLYTALMCTYIPLILRSFIIYGNVPSMAFIAAAIFLFLSFMKTKNIPLKSVEGVCFILSIALAGLYKSTTSISIIAFFIVGIVYLFKSKKRLFLVIVLLACIAGVMGSKITCKYYEHYAKDECGRGVPSISYLAMGLQYAGDDRIPGGWNGYHSKLYMDNDYDYDLTVKQSREDYFNSLKEFSKNPKMAVSFFYNKALKQWANETHALYQDMNKIWDTKRNSEAFWVKHIESGQYEKWLSFMDYHESVIYIILLLSIVFIILDRFKKNSAVSGIIDLLPLVIFIGGFLFSLIWEAQPQAVLYYPIYLLPYSISYVFNYIMKAINNNKVKK